MMPHRHACMTMMHDRMHHAHPPMMQLRRRRGSVDVAVPLMTQVADDAVADDDQLLARPYSPHVHTPHTWLWSVVPHNVRAPCAQQVLVHQLLARPHPPHVHTPHTWLWSKSSRTTPKRRVPSRSLSISCWHAFMSERRPMPSSARSVPTCEGGVKRMRCGWGGQVGAQADAQQGRVGAHL
eukprot:365936-Chlamydomonas_euryale.AAC.2